MNLAKLRSHISVLALGAALTLSVTLPPSYADSVGASAVTVEADQTQTNSRTTRRANPTNSEAGQAIAGALIGTAIGSIISGGNGAGIGGSLLSTGAMSAGVGGMAAGRSVQVATNLPNTAQCRDYLRYARSAGAPGTLSTLTRKYNACLNSAPNSAASNRYRCAPGTYVSYVNGIRRCVRR